MKQINFYKNRHADKIIFKKLISLINLFIKVILNMSKNYSQEDLSNYQLKLISFNKWKLTAEKNHPKDDFLTADPVPVPELYLQSYTAGWCKP